MDSAQHQVLALMVHIHDDPNGGAWPCDRCGELTPVRGSWRVVVDGREQIRCDGCVSA
jgi:hypothetical protein